MPKRRYRVRGTSFYAIIPNMLPPLLLASALALAPQTAETATNVVGLAAARSRETAFDITGSAAGVIHVANTVDYVFLSDSTGHAFFMAHRDADAPPIEPGDVVRLRGHHSDAASRYSTRPFVTDSAVRLASGDPPAPVPATIHEIANGSLDYKFVRTSGLVRDVADSETSREWATLSLFDDGEMLRVAVLVSDTPIERYERLIGMRIEVDGFPNPRGGSPRVFAGRSFHCAGLNAIRILDEPAADPFTAPRIETLVSKTSAQIASSGRVSLRGRVVCTWSDRLAMVKTTDRDFVHLAFDDALPAVGTYVECAGFPLTDAFHITLVRAKWRPTGDLHISEEPPQRVTAAQLLDGMRVHTEFHGHAIHLRARVRSVHEESGAGRALIVEDGNTMIALYAGAGWPGGIVPGCVVEATGVCVMEAKRWQPELVVPQIRDLSIVVRSPDDILVVSRPSWWTPTRLSILAASLLAALVAAFAWNWSLRRLAERRGRRLLAEEIGHLKADLKAAERTRLAVELHDSLAQNLTGVSMEIQTAERYGTGDIAALMRHLSIAGTSLKSCLHNLRSTLWDLRSHSLEAPDIDTAIHRTLLPHVKGVDLSISFNAPRRRLSEQDMHDVLRIIRELALNGIRHGGATRINVSGQLDGDVLSFRVADNGRGFDPSRSPGAAEGHFGIQGIRDRLRRHSGTLALDSAPGRGTAAEVTIRLDNNDG